MKKSKRTIALRPFTIAAFLLSPFCISCVDEIDVSVFNDSGTLVVDGLISDIPGTYRVRLSRSKDFFATDIKDPRFLQEEGMVQNALVTVEDDKGNKEVFSETSPGLYQSNPSTFIGCIDSKYKLNVKLEGGKTYESSTETMKSNVGFKNFYKQKITKTILDENGIERNIEGIRMSITPNDFHSSNEFYRWRWEGTYQIQTFPELNTLAYEKPYNSSQDAILPPFQAFLPDPLPCSGYIAVGPPENGTDIEGMPGETDIILVLESITPCECCTCWITEATEVSVVSTTSVGATQIHFDFYENVNPRFGQKYYVRLQQLSLSKGAHQFWKIIEQQQDNSSLFASSGREIPTNIKSIDDENEKVLGYFVATSISEIPVFLDEANLSQAPIVLDTIKDDCRKLKNSIDQKPLFW